MTRALKASCQAGALLLALLLVPAHGAAASSKAPTPAAAPDTQELLRSILGAADNTKALAGSDNTMRQAPASLGGKCITASVHAKVPTPYAPVKAQFLPPASQTVPTTLVPARWTTGGIDGLNYIPNYDCNGAPGLAFLAFATGPFLGGAFVRKESCPVGKQTYTFSSAALRGCTLAAEADPSLQGVVSVTGPDAAGTVTLTIAALAAGQGPVATTTLPTDARLRVTDCPASPPPSPSGCTGDNDGAACKWIDPDAHSWAAHFMADASAGKLRRSATSAATAASLTAATDGSGGDYAANPCAGRCVCGVCTITPKAKSCCFSDAPNDIGFGGGYGTEDYAAAHMQAVGSGAAAQKPATKAAVQRADAGYYGPDKTYTCWQYTGPYQA